MVERSLCMREVTGSMPVSSKVLGHTPFFQPISKKMASTKFTRCFRRISLVAEHRTCNAEVVSSILTFGFF